MAKETPPFTWIGLGMDHVNRHVTAASTYLQKLSQAAHPRDRVKAHAEFVKMHLEMCKERTELLNAAVARANNFMGNFVQVLQKRNVLDELVRTSPKRKRRSTKARRR
jgi:hypothetical protein